MLDSRALDTFLAEFSESEKRIARTLLLQLEDSIERWRKDAAAQPNPIDMHVSFEPESGTRVSAALRLSSKETKPATVFWLFPSSGHDRDGARNGIIVNPKLLLDAKVRAPEVEAFTHALRQSDFVLVKKIWRTQSAGMEDGLSRIFGYASNIHSFLDGIAGLASSIARYT